MSVWEENLKNRIARRAELRAHADTVVAAFEGNKPAKPKQVKPVEAPKGEKVKAAEHHSEPKKSKAVKVEETAPVAEEVKAEEPKVDEQPAVETEPSND